MHYDYVITGSDGDDVLVDYRAPASARILFETYDGQDTIVTTTAFARVVCGDGLKTVMGSDGYEVIVTGSDSAIINLQANGIVYSHGGNIIYGSKAPGDINETVSYSHANIHLDLGFNGDGTAECAGDLMSGIDRYILDDGNNGVFGNTGANFLELRTKGGDDYIDCNADRMIIRTGSGNDSLFLDFNYQTADITMGTGTDRIFCGGGADTIHFSAGKANPDEATFLYLNSFDKTEDKIAVHSQRMAKYLMSHAYETEYHGITGLWIDAPHGAVILIDGLKLADLSEAMFLV